MNLILSVIAVFLSLIGITLLVTMILVKIIKLPINLTEYDRLMKKLNIIFWVVIITALIEAMLLHIPHINILKHPVKFLVAFFTVVLPIICIFALQCICPKCGKILVMPFRHFGGIASGGVPFARDILRRKECPRCKFTFKKIK